VTVSVGDKPWVACASKHTINVEGVFAINGFQLKCKGINWQPSRSTLPMKLSVDAIRGTNTKQLP